MAQEVCITLPSGSIIVVQHSTHNPKIEGLTTAYGTVVEHLTHIPKVQGLNLETGTDRETEKMTEKLYRTLHKSDP
jgi:hypothetical protein